MMKKFLVPVDGSEHSHKALLFACELAAKFGADLHIIHVPQNPAEDRVLTMGGAAIMVHADGEALERAGEAVLEAARITAQRAGVVTVSTELVSGDPTQEILKSAADCAADAIIIGSRGLGGFGSLLLGSVSHKVNHAAPCTCITVR
jgi:nucleotide-binding universal stress UspA family protein